MKTLLDGYLAAGKELTEKIQKGKTKRKGSIEEQKTDRAEALKQLAKKRNLKVNELRLARRLFENGLSDDEQLNFRKNGLTWGIVRLLAGFEKKADRDKLVKKVVDERWGWRELADEIRKQDKKKRPIRQRSGGRKGASQPTADRQAIAVLEKARGLVASLPNLEAMGKLTPIRRKEVHRVLTRAQSAIRSALAKLKATVKTK